MLIVPKTITAGDHVVWRNRNLCARDPVTGDLTTLDPSVHQLSFAIRGEDSLDVVATADGGDFLSIIEAASSGTLTAGLYFYQAYVTRDSQRGTLQSGQIEVLVNYAVEIGLDGRSQLEKDIESIEAAIRVVIAGGVQSYSIQGRSLSRLSLGELLSLRDSYKAELQRQKAVEAINRGEPNPRRAFVRFGS
jgi:hypothetical protein